VITPSRLVVLFSVALLGAACAAPASRTAVTPEVGSDPSATGADLASVPPVAETAKTDPLVCTTVVRTGTRVARRTCVRRSQEEKMQRDAQEALEAIQRRGVQTGNPTRE
jgi:hypothetical protein